jgi:predicted DNA-binding ribbon-helix-helix protein
MARTAAIFKRSVRIAGHATSISLEPAFWDALCEIASGRRMSVNALITTIDAGRDGNLSSAIRIFVLDSCRRGEMAEATTLARPPSTTGVPASPGPRLRDSRGESLSKPEGEKWPRSSI